ATRRNLHNLPIHQRAEELPRAFAQRALAVLRFVAVANEALHRVAAVALLAAKHEEQHAVRHIETRRELLGWSGAQPFECLRIPNDRAFGSALFHELLFLLRIVGGFFLGALVFDHVPGRLRDDVALVVVTLASGAARDLPEIPHAEDGGFL